MNIAFISMSEVKNIYFISGKTTNGEPQHDKKQEYECAPSKDSGRHGHPLGLGLCWTPNHFVGFAHFSLPEICHIQTKT